MRIHHKLSSFYHPQTNNLVEHFNRTLCETLAKTNKILSSALFAYRTVNHNITSYKSFYLLYGHITILLIETNIETILFEEITIGNYKNILQKRLDTILDSLYWIKNYPNATLTIGKQTTITDNNGTHTVIRPKKTTTRREKIGNKMDKYLLESITAAILSPFSTIRKTLQEILFIDKNLSYERQLELYSYLGKIIENMKLMKKTTSEIQAEILGIIWLDVPRVLTIARRAKTLIQRFGLLDTKLILP
ncbi:hypothetical protein G9A89_020373 [Geosiphon pyriformis]|nr:hypothetical protein G9A89_020373 [Geosiphon pyriformis]